MLEQPIYGLDDLAEIRSLVHAHGWVMLASDADGRSPVISHLPVVLDPASDQVVVLGHLPWADAELHGLGDRDVVVVVQGPHGYVSPSFYAAGPYVPTWNFIVVHLHGRPELLTPEDTYQVLSDTVDHFEAVRTVPWRLDSVPEYAAELAPLVVGFRLVPDRVVAKVKLSQDKPAEVFERVLTALDRDEHHGNPQLADSMRRIVGPR